MTRFPFFDSPNRNGELKAPVEAQASRANCSALSLNDGKVRMPNLLRLAIERETVYDVSPAGSETASFVPQK
jgi:hypothetical protein